MNKRKIIVFLQKTFSKNRGHMYGQEGEDVIIYNLLKNNCKHELNHIRYLDVGCGHPTWLNNTYLLYKNGAKGWCIDANSFYSSHYKLLRHRDFFICACVGGQKSDRVIFYQTYNKDRATADLSSYELCNMQNIKLKKEKMMPILLLSDIIKQYIGDTYIDFFNIDVEGLEFDILKSLDLHSFHPAVICIEVIDVLTGYNKKESEFLVDYMNNYNYKLFLNTLVNYIFVDNDFLKNRSFIVGE